MSPDPRRCTRLAPEIRAAILTDLGRGWTPQRVAEQYSLTVRTVTNMGQRAGIVPKLIRVTLTDEHRRDDALQPHLEPLETYDPNDMQQRGRMLRLSQELRAATPSAKGVYAHARMSTHERAVHGQAVSEGRRVTRHVMQPGQR